jgi:hypothetical protein
LGSPLRLEPPPFAKTRRLGLAWRGRDYFGDQNGANLQLLYPGRYQQSPHEAANHSSGAKTSAGARTAEWGADSRPEVGQDRHGTLQGRSRWNLNALFSGFWRDLVRTGLVAYGRRTVNKCLQSNQGPMPVKGQSVPSGNPLKVYGRDNVIFGSPEVAGL